MPMNSNALKMSIFFWIIQSNNIILKRDSLQSQCPLCFHWLSLEDKFSSSCFSCSFLLCEVLSLTPLHPTKIWPSISKSGWHGTWTALSNYFYSNMSVLTHPPGYNLKDGIFENQLLGVISEKSHLPSLRTHWREGFPLLTVLYPEERKIRWIILVCCYDN